MREIELHPTRILFLSQKNIENHMFNSRNLFTNLHLLLCSQNLQQMELSKETSLSKGKLIPLGKFGKCVIVDGTLGEFGKLGKIQVDRSVVFVGPLICFPLNVSITLGTLWENQPSEANLLAKGADRLANANAKSLS